MFPATLPELSRAGYQGILWVRLVVSTVNAYSVLLPVMPVASLPNAQRTLKSGTSHFRPAIPKCHLRTAAAQAVADHLPPKFLWPLQAVCCCTSLQQFLGLAWPNAESAPGKVALTGQDSEQGSQGDGCKHSFLPDQCGHRFCLVGMGSTQEEWQPPVVYT